MRPGNVKKLKQDTGVNPIVQDVRLNYNEMRRILIEIDIRFEKIFPVDGIKWMLSIMCTTDDEGKVYIS